MRFRLRWPGRATGPRQRLVFFHPPKCGGTTIKRAVLASGRFPKEARVWMDASGSRRDAEEQGVDLFVHRGRVLASSLDRPEVDFICGHFRFSRSIWREHADGWQAVTILRRPVDRWLSHYFYNRYKSSEHYRIDQDIETFARSGRGRHLARTFVDYFGSGDDDASEPTVDYAIENLERFALVGCLERMEDFGAGLGDLLDTELDLGHHNPSPLAANDPRRSVRPETLEIVNELCALDQQIYDRFSAGRGGGENLQGPVPESADVGRARSFR